MVEPEVAFMDLEGNNMALAEDFLRHVVTVALNKHETELEKSSAPKRLVCFAKYHETLCSFKLR